MAVSQIFRPFAALLIGWACATAAAGETSPGENLVELKLALPKGDTYIRGTTDPVADLAVQLTLTNKSPKEDREKKTVTIKVGQRLSTDEYAGLKGLSPEEGAKVIEKKITTKDIEVYPENKDSFGYAYVEPRLGGVDTVDFIITPVAETEAAPAPKEGAAAVPAPAPAPAAAEAAPVAAIPRDHGPDFADPVEQERTRYLAAGETSESYTLHPGKYYKLTQPGLYTIKARMRSIGDTNAPDKVLYSNEEKFRVLPYKQVDQTIDFLRSDLADFERGHPKFDYLLYQVKSTAEFDELYAVQKITFQRVEHLEWTRVCSVKAGTTVQVAQLTPTKVAALAVQRQGDAGLYTLDFSAPGVKIASQHFPPKAEGLPKLKVEGGNISVE